MSQVQYEVRPTVVRMPMSGYMLQTGGSARRRIIKPLNAQGATDQFPISNEFRVSGVPGHTRNSSAVASVLVDLARTRGFARNFTNTWADDVIEFKAADPGDCNQGMVRRWCGVQVDPLKLWLEKNVIRKSVYLLGRFVAS